MCYLTEKQSDDANVCFRARILPYKLQNASAHFKKA